jgi:hypothetical protein
MSTTIDETITDVEDPVERFVITKQIVSWVVGAGVGTIVHRIIDNNVEPETRTQKVTVPVASLVIGYAAKDATTAYTNAKIDSIADKVTKALAFLKNPQQ